MLNGHYCGLLFLKIGLLAVALMGNARLYGADEVGVQPVTNCPVPGCNAVFIGDRQTRNCSTHFKRKHQGRGCMRCCCGEYSTNIIGDLRRHMRSTKHGSVVGAGDGSYKYIELVGGEWLHKEFADIEKKEGLKRKIAPSALGDDNDINPLLELDSKSDDKVAIDTAT